MSNESNNSNLQNFLNLNFLFKIEEEDLIVHEQEVMSNRQISIYEAEYLDMKTDFVIFKNKEEDQDNINDMEDNLVKITNSNLDNKTNSVSYLIEKEIIERLN